MPQFQTLKGFRDIKPIDARKRQWLKAKMIETAEAWGFEPLETPTLEPLDLFVGEIGEDEKLFFKFTDQGGRNVALRYDQTVPSCRFVGTNENELIFPFRRYQIQNVFRAEKPQRGRYREFTQVDIDIFGVASPIADAEVIAQNITTLLNIGFKSPVILINSRELMKGIPYEAIVAVDKLKKIGPDGVISDMINKGIELEQAKTYLATIQNLKPDETLEVIFKYLKNAGIPKSMYRFEPTLARSFSYSEGPIWELTIPEYGAGSVGGGERYDGLMTRLTGRNIPATGVGFGFDRTLEAADELGLIPTQKSASNVLVTIFSPELLSTSLALTTNLRANGLQVEMYPDNKAKLDKQMKYANRKSIPVVVIVGPEEIEKSTAVLKDMRSGAQKVIPQSSIVSEIDGMLT